MQNNSNKWRAFIITFIIITLLLVVGYFLLRNTGSSSNTKGDTIAQKFSSLFGTSKQKQINTVVDTGLGNLNPSVPPIKVGDGTDGNTTPGPENTTKPATPGLNPFPYTPSNSNGNYLYNPDYQAKSQCDDGIDNDGDGSVDKNDAGCHTDLDETNSNSYDQWLEDESAENGPNVIVDKVAPGGCVPNRNIVFNDKIVQPNTISDKDKINELLRDFYRLAPNLATKEDITIEKGNAKAYKETIDSATEYTKQCYAERKSNIPSASAAPQTIVSVEYADTRVQEGLVDPKKMFITIPPGKYLLESRKSPLFMGSTIKPSETFLPGYHGVKFEEPVVSPTLGVRKSLFTKNNPKTGNSHDISISAIIQAKGDLAGAAITSHILQGFRDAGILKYYFPNNSISPEKYEIVLSMLRDEVNKYMNTLKPERDKWADHTGRGGLSNWENWADSSGGGCWDEGSSCWDKGHEYGGIRQTKEALDAYISSGLNDELRAVNLGAQIAIMSGTRDTSYDYKSTVASLLNPKPYVAPIDPRSVPRGARDSGGGGGAPQSRPRTVVGSDLPPGSLAYLADFFDWAYHPYEVKMVNKYQSFEERFNVW